MSEKSGNLKSAPLIHETLKRQHRKIKFVGNSFHRVERNAMSFRHSTDRSAFHIDGFGVVARMQLEFGVSIRNKSGTYNPLLELDSVRKLCARRTVHDNANQNVISNFTFGD